jgi:UDP-3-O-[3-hydroxymyristoyl] glucosamine N-acyltransferase
MSMRMTLAVMVGAALVTLTVPVAAHHAVGAEYDPSKPVKVTGTVSKIEFTNPHARLYFDVTGEDGKVVTWNAELNARSILARQGWTAKSVKIGETVTVEGIRARTGVAGVHAQSITTADGRKVFIGEY